MTSQFLSQQLPWHAHYQARGFWDSLTNPTKTWRVVLPFHVPSELFWHATSGHEQQGALLSAIAGC